MTNLLHPQTLEEAIEEKLRGFLKTNQRVQTIPNQSNIFIGTASGTGIEQTEDGGFALTPQGGKFGIGTGMMGGRSTVVFNINNLYNLIPTVQIRSDKHGNFLSPEEAEESDTATFVLQKQIEMHEIPFSIQRKLPQYLSAPVLFSDKIIIPLDHHVYWTWTAIIASQKFGLTPDPRNPDPSDSSSSMEIQSIIDDYLTLTNELVYPVKRHLEEGSDPMDSDSGRTLSSIEAAKVGLKLAMNLGFSVLDGLITRHCDILNPDGEVKLDNLPEDGSGITITNGRGYEETLSKSNPYPRFYTKLLLWLQNEASMEAKEVLLKLDGLSDHHLKLIQEGNSLEDLDREMFDRYNESILVAKIEGISIGDIKEYQSFLFALSELRNRNLHGSNRTMALGAIVMNLCSLILWDMIEKEEYKAILQSNIRDLHYDPENPWHMGPGMPGQNLPNYPPSEIRQYLNREEFRQQLQFDQNMSKSVIESEFGISLDRQEE